MATTTAADVLLDTLYEWGVEVIFGLPGDGINGIMELVAPTAGQDQVRSGPGTKNRRRFMACGYAKFYRQARRVCLATSGRAGGLHPAQLGFMDGENWTGNPCLRNYRSTLSTNLIRATYSQQDVELDNRCSRTWPVTNARGHGTYPCLRMSPSWHAAPPWLIAASHTSAFFPSGPARRRRHEKRGSKRNVPHHSSDVIRTAGARLPERQRICARRPNC